MQIYVRSINHFRILDKVPQVNAADFVVKTDNAVAVWADLKLKPAGLGQRGNRVSCRFVAHILQVSVHQVDPVVFNIRVDDRKGGFLH